MYGKRARMREIYKEREREIKEKERKKRMTRERNEKEKERKRDGETEIVCVYGGEGECTCLRASLCACFGSAPKTYTYLFVVYMCKCKKETDLPKIMPDQMRIVEPVFLIRIFCLFCEWVACQIDTPIEREKVLHICTKRIEKKMENDGEKNRMREGNKRKRDREVAMEGNEMEKNGGG